MQIQRPLWKSIGYQTLKTFFWITAKTFFRFTWRGKEYFPGEGGALICCNHQSYFDPVLVGICFRQQLNFMARKTLFNTFLFGRIIRYLDAIPVDRDGMSLGGIKETLKRLKKGEGVVVFPEGTRSQDGKIGQLKPGFCALARRGHVRILPAAVDGAFDAWPRSARLPRFTKVCTVFGPEITVAEIEQMSDDQLIDELKRRIVDCHRQARQLRGLPPLEDAN
jgi:1-acyl-sn-glycerol-3-phosphate acyltransferase